MILFYSLACKHCQMLLDSVGRMDSKGVVKRVCIDTLRHTHPGLFKQIQLVPALMLLPSRELIYGKQVFDYLLLPSRGKLVVGDAGDAGAVGGNASNAGNASGASNAGNAGGAGTMSGSGVLHQEEGILPFGGLKGGFSDNFADLNENESNPSNPDCNPHSSYKWTSITEMERQGTADSGTVAAPVAGGMPSLGGMNQETRTVKETIDLDAYKQQRERDRVSLYSSQPMPIL